MRELLKDKRVIGLAIGLGILEFLSYFLGGVPSTAPTGWLTQVEPNTFLIAIGNIIIVPYFIWFFTAYVFYGIGDFFLGLLFGVSPPTWAEQITMIISVAVVSYLLSLLFIAFLNFIGRKFKKEKLLLWIENIFILFLVGLTLLILILTSIGYSRSQPKKFSCRPAKDAVIEADMAQIRIQAELIYTGKGNYSDLKYYPGGNSEIDKLGEEIAHCGGALIIEKTSDEYCIYSLLTSTSQEGKKRWYCIDSTGYTVRTTIDPSQAGYCDGVNNFVCPPWNR